MTAGTPHLLAVASALLTALLLRSFLAGDVFVRFAAAVTDVIVDVDAAARQMLGGQPNVDFSGSQPQKAAASFVDDFDFHFVEFAAQFVQGFLNRLSS